MPKGDGINDEINRLLKNFDDAAPWLYIHFRNLQPPQRQRAAAHLLAMIEDARSREVIAGASGRGAITFVYPTMMNELFGTRFKIVTGYTGGNQINLAMERGEVQARNNTWSSWKATKRAWLDEKKIAVIAQAGPRASDLDAPSVESSARTPEERQLIELIVSGTQMGRPLATTADVPAELRADFDAAQTKVQTLLETDPRSRLPGELSGFSSMLHGRLNPQVVGNPSRQTEFRFPTWAPSRRAPGRF